MNLNHLQEQKVGYFKHQLRVFKASAKLFWLAIAGIIHGIFPFLLVNTVTSGVKQIEKDLYVKRPRQKRSDRPLKKEKDKI